MMNNFFAIFFILTVLLGCGTKRLKNIPDDIIPRDRMITILVDIHLADGVLSTKKYDTKKHEYTIEGYYEYIYQKHEYTRAEIDSSIAFYSRYPLYYDKMYDEVLEKLSTMQSSMERKDTLQIRDTTKQE